MERLSELIESQRHDRSIFGQNDILNNQKSSQLVEAYVKDQLEKYPESQTFYISREALVDVTRPQVEISPDNPSERKDFSLESYKTFICGPCTREEAFILGYVFTSASLCLNRLRAIEDSFHLSKDQTFNQPEFENISHAAQKFLAQGQEDFYNIDSHLFHLRSARDVGLLDFSDFEDREFIFAIEKQKFFEPLIDRFIEDGFEIGEATLTSMESLFIKSKAFCVSRYYNIPKTEEESEFWIMGLETAINLYRDLKGRVFKV